MPPKNAERYDYIGDADHWPSGDRFKPRLEKTVVKTGFINVFYYVSL